VSDEGYWLLSLGLGLVVAIVAVILLHLLLSAVHRVERGAEQVWQAGKEVAANTSSTWLLTEAVSRVEELGEEAGRHGRLLQGAPGGDGGRPAPDRDTTQAGTEGER
jgi:hypothetical protein